MLQQIEEIMERLLNKRMEMLGSMASLVPTGQESKERAKEDEVMLMDIEPVVREDPPSPLLIKQYSRQQRQVRRRKKRKEEKGKKEERYRGELNPHSQ